ncbi:hypothetical protein LEMLEM_LOCUS12636 [Lemmus lemmus]
MKKKLQTTNHTTHREYDDLSGPSEPGIGRDGAEQSLTELP